MSMPRAERAAKVFFDKLLPDDPRVRVRPMFGNVAGFLSGNMFMGVFGGAVFLRLRETDRAELLKEEGAGLFEPFEGRPLKEYVTLPEAWRGEPEKARAWVARSVEWVTGMPQKQAGSKGQSQGGR